jgi:hypothetical protein
MPVRKIKAHKNVVADTSKFAVQRGPLVYCAEWPDQKEPGVLSLMVPPKSVLKGTFKPDLLKGLYVVTADGKSVARVSPSAVKATDAVVTLIPYYAWAHRGAGEMMVWIPENAGAARPLPSPSLASQSIISASYKTKNLKALNDQMEPQNSNDHSIVFYHWWPKKDTVQWVQYDFQTPATISSSRVYWFDDGPDGGCRIPSGWKLYYKKKNKWISVQNSGSYEINKDRYSSVKFSSVTTSALRMEITLPKEYASGIMEWAVGE